MRREDNNIGGMMKESKIGVSRGGVAPKTGAFTLAQGLDVPTQHSEACWAQIKVVQETRGELKKIRSALHQNADFKKFEEARRAFNDARRSLSAHPEFGRFEEARRVLDEARRALSKHAEFGSYERARSEFSRAHQVLSRDPSFEAYEKARSADVDANKVLRNLRRDCGKCRVSASISGV